MKHIATGQIKRRAWQHANVIRYSGVPGQISIVILRCIKSMGVTYTCFAWSKGVTHEWLGIRGCAQGMSSEQGSDRDLGGSGGRT